jgi:predicted dithiol-disulfide oxidoreductase (DUF899 family)
MTMEKPKMVTAEEWRQARDELLVAEKEATRALDSLAAHRRRLPMVKFTGILDLTPYGRQEDWEDSPPGWPQNPTSIIPNTMELGRQATGFGRFR